MSTKVSVADVKTLRDRTGAGMTDCKAALQEADGDMQKAIDILRVKGAASAAKRSGRGTAEGTVTAYTHATGRIGVLVEVRCETDFVARNEDFQDFARQVAIHIAAVPSRYVSIEEIPESEREAERRILEEKARADGKPDEIVAKIVEGQLAKWGKEVALLEQPHFNLDRYDGKTIEQLRAEVSAKTGENVRIARFARFEIGQD